MLRRSESVQVKLIASRNYCGFPAAIKRLWWPDDRMEKVELNSHLRIRISRAFTSRRIATGAWLANCLMQPCCTYICEQCCGNSYISLPNISHARDLCRLFVRTEDRDSFHRLLAQYSLIFRSVYRVQWSFTRQGLSYRKRCEFTIIKYISARGDVTRRDGVCMYLHVVVVVVVESSCLANVFSVCTRGYRTPAIINFQGTVTLARIPVVVVTLRRGLALATPIYPPRLLCRADSQNEL